jgi:hypothetical protein
MSQETNLNVAPYFDDYNEPVIGGKDNNYYKVLFKPGYPVQARELTTLQSILQNQVEQFGTHFFKEGAKVIPGSLSFINPFYYVQIEENFLGIPVDLYVNELVGKRVRGEVSGVVGIVKKVLSKNESDRANYTLYIDLIDSDSNNFTNTQFNDGENLITEEPISFGSTFILANEGFARSIALDASGKGTAFALSAGVYFLRGYFVDVKDEILLLDQYSINPSYRVGLDVIEEIISADVDPNLNDNANGFNNYAAPGADRLKITTNLAKKPIDSYDSPGFVELARVENGTLIKINNNTDYNLLSNELARRTFDESGDYYIKAFNVFVKESLSDNEGNDGIYKENQLTSSGFTPSEDLMVYKVSPGKAYVRGYEVETIAPAFLDVPKTRTTKTIENQAVNFNFGSTLTLNNVHGSPSLGINTSTTISLRDNRLGIDSTSPSGKEIGVARVYDFALESGSYEFDNQSLNRWDISLFDVQTYGDLTLNEPITLTIPTYVRGNSSGATAFLKNSISSGIALTVYQISGNFINGEKLIFDGTTETRVSIGFTDYSISDVKSLYGIVGSGNTFNSDVIQTPTKVIGNVTISPESSGISTITSPLVSFPGIVTSGNLIQYTRPDFSVKSFAKIDQVFTNSVVISGITTVSGICDGGLPQSQITVNDLTLVSSYLQKSNNIIESSLFEPLSKINVESVDLSGSSIVIRKQYDVVITDNSTNTIQSGNDEVFLPFDEERYVLTRSDGSTEILTQDKFQFNSGSNQLVINGLGSNTTGKLIATLRKSNITAKSKRKQRISTLIVDKSKYDYSGTGSTTINDGLTYGNYSFGTRVQDERICLNVPDVVNVYGIFESNDTSDPTLSKITIGSMDGPTSKTDDLIIGETFTGTVSGAKGLYAERVDSGQISFIYLNSSTFQEGEIISFNESGVNGIVSLISNGSKNISNNFVLDKGQKLTHYDYSSVRRLPNKKEPTKKIKIVYSYGFYESSDTGDITVANSYESFNYATEIASVNGFRNTDVIDVRPRVNNYSVVEGARSPFEFDGRSFANGNHSSNFILASDESETLSFNYYLPRIDRIYLTKDGVFQVKIGSSSDTPQIPEEVSGALNIANIAIPPYVYDTKNIKIDYIEHKRYQMTDIFKLENRIKNLEYYTSLSLLENNTSNLFISDASGLNRFKSGFFIDNFSSVGTQDNKIGVKNSVDLQNGQLRPSHYTTQISLEIGSSSIVGLSSTSSQNQDQRFINDIVGTNIKKSGSVVTLDYDDVAWLEQPYATRVENVTPFLVQLWSGSIKLEPDTDVWIDVNRLELRDVEMEGSFLGVAEAMRAEVSTTADGSRLGISPVIWQSWETTGVRQNIRLDLDASLNTSSSTSESFSNRRTVSSTTTRDTGGFESGRGIPTESTTTNTTLRDRSTNVTQRTDLAISGSVSLTTNLDQVRTGERRTVREQIDTESLGDRVVSRNIITFQRSRNIEFNASRLKPNTQVFAFFDDVDVNAYCVPKLLEISMTSGTFAVGEDVIGVMPTSERTSLDDRSDVNSSTLIRFRVAVSNHKYGPYNSPTVVYSNNPYDRNNIVPPTYSSTSSLLNIDTFSLQNDTQPEYFGNIRPGMILRGQTSGAQAIITENRLITDYQGVLIGSFFVPNGSISGNPIFETGRSVFRLTSSSSNSKIAGVITTVAEEIFYSQGDIDNTQEVTLSLRNARTSFEDISQTRTLTSSTSDSDTARASSTTSFNITSTEVVNSSTSTSTGYRDPLAQSFLVSDATGVFVTKVDIFFRTKDTTLPVEFYISEVNLGIPTKRIVPFTNITIYPDEIQTSEDASVPTTINFEAPVYLESQKEYAIVLLSDSTEYTVWISRLGEFDVQSLENQSTQVLVSSQPLLGSLFKSQNASTWDPSQYEDLKFKLYRADFVESGSTLFFNPSLPTDISTLTSDPLDIDSRTVRIGIGTTVRDDDLTNGNTILQLVSGAQGNLVGTAGTAKGDLNIINSGIGYTPSSGSQTFNNLVLSNVESSGRNATANITINNGVAIAATILNGGTGYSVGDVLTVSSIGISSVGRNLRLSVSGIDGANELIVTDVQGEFAVGAGYTIRYVNNSGITTDLNSAFGGNVTVTSPEEVLFDGLHAKVLHRNHGMHSDVNQVIITGAKSDIIPTSLATDYLVSSTSDIILSNSSNFSTFEGVSVGSTNPGYAIISNEIIQYTGVSGNSLTGITREIDGTKAFSYSSGDLVYKYELNDVSLLRINKTHTLSDATIDRPIGLDYYHIKVDMSSGTNTTDRQSGLGLPKLFFAQNGKFGEKSVNATYNVTFDLITPNFGIITPKFTATSASVRTVSGKSIDGNELPYEDKGFQSISLGNQSAYFDSPRVIASKVNEDSILSNLPGNKSFTMNINLISNNSKLSPCIDLNKTSVVFTTNRINSPVTNYTSDPRVNTYYEDPNACIYISNPISLKNPATALKLLVSGSIHESNDIRAFYSIQNDVSEDPIFIPFPGYGNIDSVGRKIDPAASSGLPDSLTPKNSSYEFLPTPNSFVEYEFSDDSLPNFKIFRVKLILTSTNQAYPPIIQDLRAIALA